MNHPTSCTTHTWTPTPDTTLYACTDCPTTTHACHTCNQPATDANLACRHCLTRARHILDDIREAANTPYAYTLGLKANRYDRDILTGTKTETIGGTTPEPDDQEALTALALQHNLDLLTILRDPPNVLEPLLDWAASWADARHEPTDNTNVFDYLTSRLIWAANTPDTSDWHQYLEEATTIRTRLRQLVGLANTSEPVPCVHCGGTIIQRNGPHGLEDHRHCTGCGLTWDNREHLSWVNLTTYREIPHTHPDTLITTAQARSMFPNLKRNTLNVWIKRNQIRPALTPDGEPATDIRGDQLYRAGDIADRMSNPTPTLESTPEGA